MRRLVLGLTVTSALALAAAGCGIPDPPPNAPDPAVPPALSIFTAVYPPPESTVVYDTPIWCEFRDAPDPATLTETNVFLKRDTRRVPVTLSWNGAARRLALAPRIALDLRAAYTIEITSRVRDAAGRVLADGAFWQFRTNSLRRPRAAPRSAPDVPESPFSPLRWDTTETSAGFLSYDVFAGEDSAAVAALATPVLAGREDGFWLPASPWTLDRRYFFRVRATNRSTGESLLGDVSAFQTLPASTPVDSIVVPALEWGYSLNLTNQNFCNLAGLQVSPGRTIAAWKWRLPDPADDLRLAGARVVNRAAWSGNLTNVIPRLASTAAPWRACGINKFEAPVVEQFLATGVLVAGPAVLFESVALTAHLESAARYRRQTGYSLASASTITYSLLRPAESGFGGLTLYVYRPPASAPIAVHAPQP